VPARWHNGGRAPADVLQLSGLLAGDVKQSRNDKPAIFKWRQTETGIILCAVRWYLRYSLSLRDVEELLEERGLSVNHTAVWRWVQYYGPELEQRLRRHRKPSCGPCVCSPSILTSSAGIWIVQKVAVLNRLTSVKSTCKSS